jgi:hypothetical protein
LPAPVDDRVDLRVVGMMAVTSDVWSVGEVFVSEIWWLEVDMSVGFDGGRIV